MTAADEADAHASRAVALRWARRDNCLWWLTVPAFGALVIAVVMAVFGLPPVDLHPPTHWFGIMDPFCGGTRSARLTAQGRLGEAWTYNPLGILAVLGAVAGVVRAAVGVATRRWLSVAIGWTPRWRVVAIAGVIVLVVLLEIRQQGRADLLMEGTHTFR